MMEIIAVKIAVGPLQKNKVLTDENLEIKKMIEKDVLKKGLATKTEWIREAIAQKLDKRKEK